MFHSRSRRPVRIKTLVARMTLTASVAFAVGVGIANAQQTQPQQGQQLQSPQQPQQSLSQVNLPPDQQQHQATPQQQQAQQDQLLSQPVQGVVNSNTVTTQTTVAAAPTIIASTSNADPRLSQILGVSESHCGHVIDLLIRNRIRQQSGAVGAELAPGLMLSQPPSANQFGDLELVNVQLVADGTPDSGPVIQVSVRNSSTFPVGNFQLSLVGVLGQIHAHCPTVRGTVTQIPAGAIAAFELQLPVSAMAMGFQGQPAAPFDTVVVAIDSFDELLEANELNNVRIIRRAELLPPAPATVTQTVTSTVTPVDPMPSGPTAPADTAIPSPTEPASPLDGIKFEDLQLESTTPTAAGMAEFFRNAKS